MADDAGFPVANLLAYGALTVLPVALCWVVFTLSPRVCRAVRARRRPPPVASGPPIERIAADLRRVRRDLAGTGAPTPMARRRGIRQAYDALLVQACAALAVPHRLTELPEGMDLEVERLRVEHALRSAGLALA